METFNLDPRQLARIEAVHRGFLYQHLYAATCLFHAARAGVTHVIVENDETSNSCAPTNESIHRLKCARLTSFSATSRVRLQGSRRSERSTRKVDEAVHASSPLYQIVPLGQNSPNALQPKNGRPTSRCYGHNRPR
jgi:hypothetical protein